MFIIINVRNNHVGNGGERVIDTVALAAAIEKSGYKQKFIAEKLLLSQQCLNNKILGKRKFNHSEIVKLESLLKLSKKESNSIFLP